MLTWCKWKGALNSSSPFIFSATNLSSLSSALYISYLRIWREGKIEPSVLFHQCSPSPLFLNWQQLLFSSVSDPFPIVLSYASFPILYSLLCILCFSSPFLIRFQSVSYPIPVVSFSVFFLMLFSPSRNRFQSTSYTFLTMFLSVALLPTSLDSTWFSYPI